jgi:hypothetical protein
MALAATLVPVNQADGSLVYTTVDGPTHLFSNQSLNAKLLAAAVVGANGKFAVVAGFEPNLFVYGTASTFSLDVYTSPDGANWIKVATITEATAIKSLGRNELHFPVKAIAVDLTAVAGGNVSVQIYAERRK